MKIALSVPQYGQIDSNLPVPTTTGQNVIWTLINVLLVVAVLLTVWFILMGGWNIITSEGKKEKMENGRKQVMYALMGLILVFLSFLFINVIGAFFGINLLSLPF
jgi:small-conductance mechanosensitive channel